MVYDSQISFTLDTICPWTYMSKKRLDQALEQYRTTSPSASICTFKVHYYPYQLYPKAPPEGQDKYEWHRDTKYNGSEEKMKMYTAVMQAEGVKDGIDFKFGGQIANTLDAHRVIQYFQEERGEDVADKIVNALYTQYFTQEQHPSSDSTLLTAAIAAGIPENEAKEVISNKSIGLRDVQQAIREQAMNGVDSVPNIMFEGKRRDFTCIGAKSIEEYIKVMENVAKESK